MVTEVVLFTASLECVFFLSILESTFKRLAAGHCNTSPLSVVVKTGMAVRGAVDVGTESLVLLMGVAIGTMGSAVPALLVEVHWEEVLMEENTPGSTTL